VHDGKAVDEVVHHWQTIKKRWVDYCRKQGEALGYSILFVQVEDSTDKLLTKTN